MGRGCVLCPTSRKEDIPIPKQALSHVVAVVAFRVSPFLLAAGRRLTPWDREDPTTLPGPRPGVCCSWGVATVMVMALQPNYLRITGAQHHPLAWPNINTCKFAPKVMHGLDHYYDIYSFFCMCVALAAL